MNENKQDPRPQHKSPQSKQGKHSNIHNNRPQLKNQPSAENKSKQQQAPEAKEMEHTQTIPPENLTEDDKAALTEGFYFFAKDTTFPQLGITNSKLLEALATTGITQPARIQAKVMADKSIPCIRYLNNHSFFRRYLWFYKAKMLSLAPKRVAEKH